MSETKNLLFELGSEELPPKTLLNLAKALQNGIVAGLNEAGLTFSGSRFYATPRRLAVLIENLAIAQPNKTVEKRGPALQAAYAPDGSPSKAALGFAASCGTTFEQLQELKTDKGAWLTYTQEIAGRSTAELIPDIIRKSLAALPIAKRMRWGKSTTEFVRPVHWAVLLFGEQVIDAEILGLDTGRTTQGHRFHAPDKLTIASPDAYVKTLREQGRVIADFEARKVIIRDAANQAAGQVGGSAHIEDDLLEEVAALNEWPVPVTGNFDPRFLELPAEVLITTMQTNQKYFPVKSQGGALLSHFITFSNIESTRPESIRQGNERVITPRLTDAEFFWKQDRKKALAERVLSMSSIVFQEKLGTVADKTERVIKLAELIANLLHADVEHAKRAALLSKADLLTDMVGEFGNLQGIMGRYYALADGEPAEVAQAIEEHYLPKQSGGPTPGCVTGQIVALADKIDTLCGIFSAGLIPTGDKDPYALRRAAIGVLRIVIENRLTLNIRDLIDFALQQFTHAFDVEATRLAVTDFVFDRLKGYCLDQGYTADEFEAIMAIAPSEPLDFIQRLAAVKTFRQLPEAESLAAANKRIRNILKKSETAPAATVGALAEAQEQRLLEAANAAGDAIKPLLAQRDYQGTLSRLAQMEPVVNDFFDHVMVMCDDLELRANRLALLALLSEQFLTCADISKLQS
ncbi:glycine--tRNA ligase subunit beta [Methylomicrobium sp. Wu6]|uniref:glycine--tRNA ligase subunit beta n=1 Tax=Methylomicrobium sp. Wu6 TaxID=3107928 RepID=UPI002DD646D9|nr:glycine--tRNA ligase subunit beta [Methylomicrobium sp. Wu6]MEC4749675.1 glycine--tRNA ligase subunit beta [Methylomicrobium sp. Wu6]